jgi:integrase
MEMTLQHVTVRDNKDGTKRYYFRRRGQPFTALPGEPKSPEFMAAYQRCLNWVAPAAAVYAGSFEELGDRYMRSPAFTTKAAATQGARRRVILSMMREPLDPEAPEKFGQERADQIGPAHIEVLRDRKADNPNAGNERLKILSQMFKFAKRKPNPVRDVERLAVPKGGHETATDEDIAAYEAKHASGPARLAMTILKATGVRVSDLRLLGRQHVKNGLLSFTTVKTKMLCELPVGPDLAAALPRDNMTFLLTEEGAPFASDKALSQRVAKWFRQAGVNGVTAHGVRKWLASKMAEDGSTEYDLMSWFGWKDPKEARPYVQAANRRRMAHEAGRKRGLV